MHPTKWIYESITRFPIIDTIRFGYPFGGIIDGYKNADEPEYILQEIPSEEKEDMFDKFMKNRYKPDRNEEELTIVFKQIKEKFKNDYDDYLEKNTWLAKYNLYKNSLWKWFDEGMVDFYNIAEILKWFINNSRKISWALFLTGTANVGFGLWYNMAFSYQLGNWLWSISDYLYIVFGFLNDLSHGVLPREMLTRTGISSTISWFFQNLYIRNIQNNLAEAQILPAAHRNSRFIAARLNQWWDSLWNLLGRNIRRTNQYERMVERMRQANPYLERWLKSREDTGHRRIRVVEQYVGRVFNWQNIRNLMRTFWRDNGVPEDMQTIQVTRWRYFGQLLFDRNTINQGNDIFRRMINNPYV